MVTMSRQQAGSCSLDPMDQLTQEGWASGRQARNSKMKIQASRDKCIQMVLDQWQDQVVREERKRGDLPYFQAQPSSPKSQFSTDKTQSDKLL